MVAQEVHTITPQLLFERVSMAPSEKVSELLHADDLKTNPQSSVRVGSDQCEANQAVVR
jgi:hypothetical protein